MNILALVATRDRTGTELSKERRWGHTEAWLGGAPSGGRLTRHLWKYHWDFFNRQNGCVWRIRKLGAVLFFFLIYNFWGKAIWLNSASKDHVLLSKVLYHWWVFVYLKKNYIFSKIQIFIVYVKLDNSIPVIQRHVRVKSFFLVSSCLVHWELANTWCIGKFMFLGFFQKLSRVIEVIF